jgi:plastocyanin
MHNNRMRLVTGLAAGAVAAGMLAATPVAAVTTTVNATNSKTFTPAAVTSAVGGGVHWQGTPAEEHSVTQDAGVFNSGAPRANLDFTRKFSAGTFAYHCTKHGTLTSGMRGTVRVAPQTLPAPAGLNFTVKWAAAGTNTGNRFDVMYRVGSGPWKTWRNGTSARSMVFGGAGSVAVARGKSYSFKVRSGSGAGKSDFSPAKSFRAS